MTLTITLPLPPKELSPNARCHWAKKANAVRRYRVGAKCRALLEITGPKPLHKSAQTEIAWYAKTATHPDPDNANASLKAAFDGIVSAGFLADDKNLSHAPIWFGVDKKNPRVVITVRPTER